MATGRDAVEMGSEELVEADVERVKGKEVENVAMVAELCRCQGCSIGFGERIKKKKNI